MSKIEVDEITQQSGTTLTVGGGACKTATLDATTVTIGRSGGTVSLASGATQSGFGRSGSVDWQTTPKTSTFTAASGEGYFINSGSSITANLPAGSAGAIVAFADYARNFNTHNFVISPNGSEKIGGVAANLTLDVDGQAITLVYVDGTKGWVNVQNAEDTETGIVPAFITATGGTISTVCTNFKVHTFTSPGTFCVSCAGNAAGSNSVDYLVVAGGGAGGRGATNSGNAGGGGGAGGFRESPGAVSGCYSTSPLKGGSAITLTASPFPVTVGAGGSKAPFPAPSSTGSPAANGSGSNSIFAGTTTITSTGGGGAGNRSDPTPQGGAPGGSGGGGTGGNPGGTGNTPSVSPSQGTNGGTATGNAAGGGGGATVAGSPSPGPNTAGPGGAGATTNISGSPVAYAGGGGAGGSSNGSGASGAPGGTGGGGTGSDEDGSPSGSSAGTTNRGGGGGGGGGSDPGTSGANGGSGIVIIRYKFQ